jgi:hypothetical protein
MQERMGHDDLERVSAAGLADSDAQQGVTMISHCFDRFALSNRTRLPP